MAPAGATRRPTSLLTANGFTRRQVHRLRPDCFLEHPDAPQPVPGLILQWAREEAGGVGGVDHLRPDRAGGDLIIQMAPYAPAQASPTRYAGGSSPGERLERGEEVLGHHQGVTEKPGRALRRRGKDLPGDPGLRGIAAWPLPVTLLLVLVLGSAVVAGAYWLLALLAPIDESSGLTAAQRLTAAFATATALGAMAALVINIRKQDLAEQAARREIASAFTERFRAAASQLGGVSPAERLAGVYAMAALADEYPRRSQQCVDVLCGYLRLPFNPDTDNLASQTSTTATASESGAAGSIAKHHRDPPVRQPSPPNHRDRHPRPHPTRRRPQLVPPELRLHRGTPRKRQLPEGAVHRHRHLRRGAVHQPRQLPKGEVHRHRHLRRGAVHRHRRLRRACRCGR